jgi:hypothetical protein
VLELKLEDLQRVTETYLQPGQASIAVITSQLGLEAVGDTVSKLDLSVKEL